MRKLYPVLPLLAVASFLLTSNPAFAQSTATVTLPEGGTVNLVSQGPRGPLHIASAIQMLRGMPVATYQSPGAATQNVNGWGGGNYGSSAYALNGGGMSQREAAFAIALGQDARGYNPDFGWMARNDAYKTSYEAAVVALAFRTGDVDGFKAAVVAELNTVQGGLTASRRREAALAAELQRATLAGDARAALLKQQLAAEVAQRQALAAQVATLTAAAAVVPSTTTGGTPSGTASTTPKTPAQVGGALIQRIQGP